MYTKAFQLRKSFFRISILSLSICFFLGTTHLMATTYYVATDGDDALGDGSVENPWATLYYANQQVERDQDHTIFMKAGTHIIGTPTLNIALKSGVNLVGAGIDSTILISAFVDKWDILRLWFGAGNQVLSDFTIDGDDRQTDKGIDIMDRDNITVRNVKIKDFRQFGLTFYYEGLANNTGPPSGYIYNIKAHDLIFENCGNDYNGWSSGAFQIGNIDGGEFYNIDINKGVTPVDDHGYGIKFYSDGYNKNIKIHDCDITVPPSDPSWTRDCAIELWNTFENSEIYNIKTNGWLSFVKGDKEDGDYGLRIYNNELIVPEGEDSGVGIEMGVSDAYIYNNHIEGFLESVASWGGGFNDNIHIHHNLFKNMRPASWDPNSYGVKIDVFANTNGAYSNFFIYNNVYHSTTDDGVTDFFFFMRVGPTESITNVHVANNIIYHENSSDSHRMIGSATSGTGELIDINIENNAYYNTALGTNGPSVSFSNNIEVDPQFAFMGVDNSEYYAPLPGSPVIDAGIDVGFPYDGDAPDMGFGEFGLITSTVNVEVEDVLVYPNPIEQNGFLNLKNSDFDSYIIRDINGSIVANGLLRKSTVNSILIPNLSQGMYVLTLNNEGIVVTKKLVVR